MVSHSWLNPFWHSPGSGPKFQLADRFNMPAVPVVLETRAQVALPWSASAPPKFLSIISSSVQPMGPACHIDGIEVLLLCEIGLIRGTIRAALAS